MSSDDDDDSKDPLVFDQGSETLKVGFAGEDSPSHIIPTVVGHPSEYRIDDEKPEGCLVFGEDAFNNQETLQIKHPIEQSIVANWDLMEKLWNFVFYQKLKVAPEEYPILLTEPALNPKGNRERTTQIMFETFNVPAMYLGAQSALSLYAYGKMTGVIFDSGHGETRVVPFYEGNMMPHAIRNIGIAGWDLTDFMAKLLQEEGHISPSTPDSVKNKVAKDIKETICYAAADFNEQYKTCETNSESHVKYKLPDDKEITLSNELFKCPEALFNPSFLGFECGGVVDTLFESINSCDVDIRDKMYSNVFLSGGTTLFPGIATRVQNELTALAPMNARVKVVDRPGDEKKFSAWVGGSILASLSTFEDMWVSKSKYDEHGPTLIHKYRL